MIQGAINQLIGMAAAAKTKADVVERREKNEAEKQAKAVAREQAAKLREQQKLNNAIAKEQAAKEKAMQRAMAKAQAKWDQNQDYQRFKETLVGKENQAPEELKRILYEKYDTAAKAVKKSGGDITKFSPDAQAQIIREVNK